MRFVQSDWFSALGPETRFDLVIANPPYLTESEFAETAPEVRDHEPKTALTPDGDGLGALRAIIDGARRFLSAGGLLALETGVSQHPELLGLLAASGYRESESQKDLAGLDRFLFARWES